VVALRLVFAIYGSPQITVRILSVFKAIITAGIHLAPIVKMLREDLRVLMTCLTE
jgi:hypothetical protein